jgi:hypothetical protein
MFGKLNYPSKVIFRKGKFIMNKWVILIAILIVLDIVLEITKTTRKVPEQKIPPVLSVVKP